MAVARRTKPTEFVSQRLRCSEPPVPPSHDEAKFNLPDLDLMPTMILREVYDYVPCPGAYMTINLVQIPSPLHCFSIPAQLGQARQHCEAFLPARCVRFACRALAVRVEGAIVVLVQLETVLNETKDRPGRVLRDGEPSLVRADVGVVVCDECRGNDDA